MVMVTTTPCQLAGAELRVPEIFRSQNRRLLVTVHDDEGIVTNDDERIVHNIH
jgi:hypothetical protein